MSTEKERRNCFTAAEGPRKSWFTSINQKERKKKMKGFVDHVICGRKPLKAGEGEERMQEMIDSKSKLDHLDLFACNSLLAPEEDLTTLSGTVLTSASTESLSRCNPDPVTVERKQQYARQENPQQRHINNQQQQREQQPKQQQNQQHKKQNQRQKQCQKKNQNHKPIFQLKQLQLPRSSNIDNPDPAMTAHAQQQKQQKQNEQQKEFYHPEGPQQEQRLEYERQHNNLNFQQQQRSRKYNNQQEGRQINFDSESLESGLPIKEMEPHQRFDWEDSDSEASFSSASDFSGCLDWEEDEIGFVNELIGYEDGFEPPVIHEVSQIVSQAATARKKFSDRHVPAVVMEDEDVDNDEAIRRRSRGVVSEEGNAADIPSTICDMPPVFVPVHSVTPVVEASSYTTFSATRTTCYDCQRMNIHGTAQCTGGKYWV